jgi:hypothetical protein
MNSVDSGEGSVNRATRKTRKVRPEVTWIGVYGGVRRTVTF